MTAEVSNKLRVALAVFEPANAAARAIVPLVQAGVPLSRLGLILRQGAAHGLGQQLCALASKECPLASLTDGLVHFCAAPDGEALMVSPCLLKRWQCGWRLPAVWIDTHDDRAEPRLAGDLERRVRSGGAVLAVESAYAREHWRCTRTLLEQSSSQVLALECSFAGADSNK